LTGIKGSGRIAETTLNLSSTVLGFDVHVEWDSPIRQRNRPSTLFAIDNYDDLTFAGRNECRLAKPNEVRSRVRERVDAASHFQRKLHLR
jgi:hypothetical protein